MSAPTKTGAAAGSPRGWVRCGPAALVALAAAVVTAHGLAEVAVAAHVPEPLAWAYPLITDGLALVAYTATNRLDGAGRGYAWVVVVVAAAVSGLAQAAYLATGALPEAPAWLRAGIGAWPAIAAAVAAHLLHLLADVDSRTSAASSAVGTPEGLAEPEQVAITALAAGEPPPEVPDTADEQASEPATRPITSAGRPQPTEATPDVDPRVQEIAELLGAGADVTGPQAAAIHGVSDRTGRRLLADARTHLEQHPATTRLGLRLVEPATAGGTA